MSHLFEHIREPAPSPIGLRPLLVSNDFAPQVGGIQAYAHHIARRLPNAAAFLADHPEADRFDDSLPFPVHRGHSPYLWPTRSTERGLRAAIDATGANVLLFLAPFPLAALAPRFGLPWAVCTHGAELVLPGRLPLVRQVYRRSLRAADCLFAVSAHTGRHLRELVGSDGPPIRLLPPGVALERFHPAVDAAAVRARLGLDDDPVVLSAGRLVARKGQDVLVRAIPEIRRRVPGTRVVIVGDGPKRRSLERVARRLPDGAVIFAGRVSFSELPAYYRAADVFVHPNRSLWWGLEEEGFGIVFLEAQASGVPVIAGRSGGSPEALRDGESGVLVDGQSVSDLADAVVVLLTDAQRRHRMSQAGRRFVEEHFDWDTIVTGLEVDLAAVAAGERLPSEL